MTPEQITSAKEAKITIAEVDRDAAMIVEFVDYIRWLADQDFSLPLTAGQLWALFYEGVRVGRLWIEVCEDLELPTRDDWT